MSAQPRLDERYADWVDERLSDAERSALEETLRDDDALRTAADDYRSTVEMVRGALARDDRAPLEMVDAVMAATGPAAGSHGGRLVVLWGSLAAAAGLVVWLGAGLMTGAGPGVTAPAHRDLARTETSDAKPDNWTSDNRTLDEEAEEVTLDTSAAPQPAAGGDKSVPEAFKYGGKAQAGEKAKVGKSAEPEALAEMKSAIEKLGSQSEDEVQVRDQMRKVRRARGSQRPQTDTKDDAQMLGLLRRLDLNEARTEAGHAAIDDAVVLVVEARSGATPPTDGPNVKTAKAETQKAETRARGLAGNRDDDQDRRRFLDELTPSGSASGLQITALGEVPPLAGKKAAPPVPTTPQTEAAPVTQSDEVEPSTIDAYRPRTGDRAFRVTGTEAELRAFVRRLRGYVADRGQAIDARRGRAVDHNFSRKMTGGRGEPGQAPPPPAPAEKPGGRTRSITVIIRAAR